RLFAGLRVPENLAAALLLAGGFLGALAVYQACARRLRSGQSRARGVLAALTLGFGNLAPYLLRRPIVYEVAIGAGYCFAMWGAYALLRGLEASSRRWLGAAGLLLGLAVGGRPTLVILLPAAVALAWRAGRDWGALALFGGSVLAVLGAYN